MEMTFKDSRMIKAFVTRLLMNHVLQIKVLKYQIYDLKVVILLIVFE